MYAIALNMKLRKRIDAITVLCIIMGFILPIGLGLRGGSLVSILLSIDQFSTGLWIVLFAFLWFWYSSMQRLSELEARSIEHEIQENRIVPSAANATHIAQKEAQVHRLSNEGSIGLSVVEKGIVICAAISGLAKMSLWLTVAS